MNALIETEPKPGYEPLESHLLEAFYDLDNWYLRLSEKCASQRAFWTPEVAPEDPSERKTLLDETVPRALRGLWVLQRTSEAIDEETGERESLRLTPQGNLVLRSESSDGTLAAERTFEWSELAGRWFMAQCSRYSGRSAASVPEGKVKLLGCVVFGEDGELGDEEYEFGSKEEEAREARKKGVEYFYRLAEALGFSKELLNYGPC